MNKIEDKIVKMYLKRIKTDKFRFLHSKYIINYNIERMRMKRRFIKNNIHTKNIKTKVNI